MHFIKPTKVLYKSIINDDIELFRKAANSFADLNANTGYSSIDFGDKNKYSPLTLAIRLKRKEFVKDLLYYGAMPALTDYNNVSPIEMAVKCRDKESLRLLINNFLGDIEDGKPEHHGFISMCLRNKSLNSAKILIDCGVEYCEESDWEIKKEVVEQGNAKYIRFLQGIGVSFDHEVEISEDSKYTLPLICFTPRDNREVAELLVGQLLDIDDSIDLPDGDQYLSLIEWAATNNKPAIFFELLKKGAYTGELTTQMWLDMVATGIGTQEENMEALLKSTLAGLEE